MKHIPQILLAIFIMLLMGSLANSGLDTLFKGYATQAREAKAVCEATLPRNQQCIVTAIPDVQKQQRIKLWMYEQQILN